jgi:hypothetical protein
MSHLQYRPTLLLFLAAFLATPCAAWAQGESISLKELESIFDSPKRTAYLELVNAKRQPSDADQPVLNAAAKWYVYRLRITTWQLQPNKLYDAVVRDFDSNQSLIRTNTKQNPSNREFQKRYSKELIACFRDVLSRNANDAQVLINAAQMLPMLAKNGQEEVGDFLAELVSDPKQHDAVKHFALRGLGEFFIAAPPDVGALGAPDKKERDAKRIEAVMEFLKRKSPLSEGSPPDQVEALRFVRREAIRALGQIKVPALDVEVKKNKVIAPVAMALLGVLNAKGSGIEPAPNLTEQYEAAAALCQMNGRRIEEFDQALTLYFVASFLADFATEYNRDRENFGKGPNKGGKLGALYQWKAMTSRLRSGLTELINNTKGDPAFASVHAKAVELAKKSDLLLNITANQTQSVDAPIIQALRDFAQTAAPKTKTAPVFKGIKGLEITIE